MTQSNAMLTFEQICTQLLPAMNGIEMGDLGGRVGPSGRASEKLLRLEATTRQLLRKEEREIRYDATLSRALEPTLSMPKGNPAAFKLYLLECFDANYTCLTNAISGSPPRGVWPLLYYDALTTLDTPLIHTRIPRLVELHPSLSLPYESLTRAEIESATTTLRSVAADLQPQASIGGVAAAISIIASSIQIYEWAREKLDSEERARLARIEAERQREAERQNEIRQSQQRFEREMREMRPIEHGGRIDSFERNKEFYKGLC